MTEYIERECKKHGLTRFYVFPSGGVRCVECNAERRRKYYQENREKAREYSRKYNQENQEYYRKYYQENREKKRKYYQERYQRRYLWFNAWKTNKGCSVCGYNKYSGSLDMHHVDNNKEFGIGGAASCMAFKRLWNEMKKCIVICKNCHYELHAKERGTANG